MKRVFLAVVFICCSTSASSQEMVVNFGYQESDNFWTFITGVTSYNIDATLFIKRDVGLDEYSNFIAGSRVAYLHYIRNDGITSFYIGPHLGGYFLKGNELNNDLDTSGKDKLSLNIGGTMGLFINYVNFAVDYGYDGLFETTYIGVKVGFDFTDFFY